MRTLAHLIAAALAIALAAPCSARTATPLRPYAAHATHTAQGPALHATPAPRTPWANVPHSYALGVYRSPAAPVHGYSALRGAHVARLQHCNPFAGVTATQPLALCNSFVRLCPWAVVQCPGRAMGVVQWLCSFCIALRALTTAGKVLSWRRQSTIILVI